jgi:mono/diheme cytochrome c family protein
MRTALILSTVLSFVLVFYTNCGSIGDKAASAIAGDPDEGELVYTGVTPSCVSCHGADGTGVFGQAGSIVGKSNKVASTIRSGISSMPSYNADAINAQELADLIAYVSTL